MMSSGQPANKPTGKSWNKCAVCRNKQLTFSSPHLFAKHLRDYHSTKEGGSFVCRFGDNDICSSLPLEGVSDQDYEAHIAKCHIFPKKTSSKSQSGLAGDKQKNPGEPAAKMSHERRRKKSPAFPTPNEAILASLVGENAHQQNSQPNLISDGMTKWTVYSSSQNLASVLNDPSKPRSYSEAIFTKDWGAHFVDTGSVLPSPFHPKISHIHFENYVRKVLRRSKVQKRRARSESMSVQQVPLRNIESRVPKVFFDSDFDLQNIETFKTVLSFCTNKDSLLQSSPSSPTKWNSITKDCLKELQRNFSEYLDVVEEQLAAKIAVRSKDFFQVMNAMDTVMSQLNKTIKEVTLLRRKCSQLETFCVKPRLRNIQLTRARNNAIAVLDKINLMATVNQTQPTIQLLLSNSVDFVGALALISTSQEVVSQELSGIHSFRHLKLQLIEIEKVIDRIMQEEFVKYLTSEWNRPLDIQEEKYIQEEEKLLAIVYGMVRIQRFNFIEVFREEGSTAIKAVVKQTVIEILSGEDEIEVGQRDSSLFDQLRCIDFKKWVDLLKVVFRNILALLKRIEAVKNVIYQGFSEVSNKNSDEILQIADIATNTDETVDTSKLLLKDDFLELTSNLRESFCSICDYAHRRCANLIESRAKNGALDKLSSSEFVLLVKEIEDFENQCQSICGRKSPNLKLVLQTQANKFANRFHDERKKRLNSNLDIEQWKSIDSVSKDFQHLITQITENSVKLNEISKNKLNGDNNQKPCCFVMVSGQKFVIVNAVMALINMLVEYCQCASEIKALAPDLLTRLLDLLKLFNSKTSQLVLGAGALQVAGLKTITARNLIISSRCLKLIIVLIPYIKAHFENLLPTKQSMLKHFDEILKNYKDHMEKIPEKVTSVVKDVIEVQLSKWEAKPPVPSPQFLAVSQHLVRLHENIQEALPITELVDLFNKIHEVFKLVLRTHLSRLKIVNDGSPQHGLVIQELTFHVQNLRKLVVAKHIKFASDDLWDCN